MQHVADEGDADVVIVKKALELAVWRDVIVHAEDTDILVLLMYHSPQTSKIFLETKSEVILNTQAQLALGSCLCRCLLFAHAMSGCDTTPSFFSHGKIKSQKILEGSEEIQQFFAQEQDLFKIQCVNILLISNNKIYQQYQNPPQSCARHENRGRNSGL